MEGSGSVYMKNDYQKTSTIAIVEEPIYCGYWSIDPNQLRVSTKTKPNAWNRFWFNFFFGIKWYDNNRN